MKKLLLLPLILLATACGSQAQQSIDHSKQFRSEERLESWVAGYLNVPEVDCEKLDVGKASCLTADGDQYYILCLTEDESGGRNCTIARSQETR